ncbi:MAG: hypothetical protein ISR64_07285 [Deltaproteobacteria bacterium]|nr:hypothetical protein [Deltaproteobacteria bacterium]
MIAQLAALVSSLAVALPSLSFDSDTRPWPAGVTYRVAGTESVAFGPSTVFPQGSDVWLFDGPTHAFVRVGPEGQIRSRVFVTGLAHTFVVRDDGSIAWVDLTRGRVAVVDKRGVIQLDNPLAPGLKHVRRMVAGADGALWLHTAYQETFRVPLDRDADLKEWFQGKREGLVFESEPAVGATVSVRGGRVHLTLFTPPETPGEGAVKQEGPTVDPGEEALAADLVGGDQEGWWIRVTLGTPGAARDRLIRVDRASEVTFATDLDGPGTLSWPDTLWVRPDGSVVQILSTDQGIRVRSWRAP